MPKRNNDDGVDVQNLTASIDLDRGLVYGLLRLDHDELVVLLAHIANLNEANISITSITFIV